MLGTSIDEAEVACERLRRTVEADVFETTQGDPLKITLSIGIVQCSEDDVGSTAANRTGESANIGGKKWWT